MTKSILPLVLLAVLLAGCDRQRDAHATAGQVAPDDEAKIASAESAAPPAIARHATIMDWPHMEGGEMRVLREGTNGWVCFPSTPTDLEEASGDDPMCFDGPWLAWAEAWQGRTTPAVDRIGIAYMLQGDRGASNIDPYATDPSPDNEWVQTPAHIMIVTPNAADLDALPTDPSSGGPYVMWKGTPYAHIMVPVE